MHIPNTDPRTVKSFGDEWSRFDQSSMPEEEARRIFSEYFAIFPWDRLPQDASGFDMGCGSGRWAKWVAPRVGRLHCIDPSDAIYVARRNLEHQPNVVFHRASVDDDALPPDSQDFGYSLGVLHHIPDTEEAIRSCAKLLKSGAPLLLYLYYAFDNRPVWFRGIWRVADLMRRVISALPPRPKHFVTDLIALLVYFPLARTGWLLEKCGLKPRSMPLYYYRELSFYSMRTDARDRFGTPLEQRFTQQEIQSMMESAGLLDVRFSESTPYWCAVGIKR